MNSETKESCFQSDGSILKEPLIENQYEINMSKLRRSKRRLIIACVVCIIFMVVEFIGGYIASSYAIMSDAAHLFTDLSGFLVSLISILVSEKKRTMRHTYGFYRFEVIGAIFSVLLIWIFTGIIAYNAVLRFFDLDKVEINGMVMFILSIGGIIINIGLMFVFHGQDHDHGDNKKSSKNEVELKVVNIEDPKDKNTLEIISNNDEDINMKNEVIKEEKRPKRKQKMNINVEAAYLHALGDLIQSIGIIVASIFVWANEKMFRWVDPAVTLFFSVIVLYTTISLLRRSYGIVMESTPPGMSISEIENEILRVDGVQEVHDLHIWSLTDDVYCCSCHVLISEEKSVCRILIDIENILALHYINHTTIQIEHVGHQNRCVTSCRDPNILTTN